MKWYTDFKKESTITNGMSLVLGCYVNFWLRNETSCLSLTYLDAVLVFKDFSHSGCIENIFLKWDFTCMTSLCLFCDNFIVLEAAMTLFRGSIDDKLLHCKPAVNKSWLQTPLQCLVEDGDSPCGPNRRGEVQKRLVSTAYQSSVLPPRLRYSKWVNYVGRLDCWLASGLNKPVVMILMAATKSS